MCEPSALSEPDDVTRSLTADLDEALAVVEWLQRTIGAFASLVESMALAIPHEHLPPVERDLLDSVLVEMAGAEWRGDAMAGTDWSPA